MTQPYVGRHRAPSRTRSLKTSGYALPTAAAASLVLTAAGASAAQTSALGLGLADSGTPTAPQTAAPTAIPTLPATTAALGSQIKADAAEQQARASRAAVRSAQAARAAKVKAAKAKAERLAAAKKKAAAEKKAAQEKAAQEKAEQEQAAQERAAQEKAEQERQQAAAEAQGQARTGSTAASRSTGRTGSTAVGATPLPSGSAADPAPASSGWQMPAAGAPFTSGYGYRWGRIHAGHDYAMPIGTPLRAMASGTVIFAGAMQGYGYAVDIRYADGTVSRYGHLSSILVAPGQQVAGGTTVALSGNTGRSTGPHLHLEIHPAGGGAVDPSPWLAAHGLG